MANTFDDQSVGRIARAVRAIEAAGLLGTADSSAPHPGLQLICAKLTSKSGTKYGWSQERRTQSGWESVTGGLSGTTTARSAYDLDEAATSDLTNKHVVLVRVPVKQGSGSITLEWVILAVLSTVPNPLFIVNLTKTSGTIGSKTTASTWFYSVASLAGTTLATGKSPEKPRMFGSFNYASQGYAYYDNSGTLHLAEAWETPGTGGC